MTPPTWVETAAALTCVELAVVDVAGGDVDVDVGFGFGEAYRHSCTSWALDCPCAD